MSTFQFKTTENAFLGALHVLKRLADDATIRAEERMACNTVITAMAEFVEQAWADMTWAINDRNHSDPGNFLHAAAGLLCRHQEGKREVRDLKAEAFKRRDVPTLSMEELQNLAKLVDLLGSVRDGVAAIKHVSYETGVALRKASMSAEVPASDWRAVLAPIGDVVWRCDDCGGRVTGSALIVEWPAGVERTSPYHPMKCLHIDCGSGPEEPS